MSSDSCFGFRYEERPASSDRCTESDANFETENLKRRIQKGGRATRLDMRTIYESCRSLFGREHRHPPNVVGSGYLVNPLRTGELRGILYFVAYALHCQRYSIAAAAHKDAPEPAREKHSPRPAATRPATLGVRARECLMRATITSMHPGRDGQPSPKGRGPSDRWCHHVRGSGPDTR
jgi:hypothetical protein